MHINKRSWVLVLAIAAAPSLVLAFGKPAPTQTWDTLGPAWDKVSARLIKFAGEDKQKLLSDLAFAVVTSSQCEGLDLDRDKFKADFDSMNDTTLPAADQAEYGPKLMSFYGVYVGLLMAEGALENAAFCGYALDKHAKGEGKYWLTPKPDAK